MMRKRAEWMMGVALLMALMAGVGLLSTGAAEEGVARFHVATDGNDAWSGTLAEPTADAKDGPFATLERARDAVRALKSKDGLPPKGIEVLVRGGMYCLTQPFTLGAEDAGTENARVTYRAAEGEEVRLIGGALPTGFAPVTDEAELKRLDESARGKVVRADLKAQGVTDYGPSKAGGMEVFFRNEPMWVSRWPNEGFVKIADIVVDDGHVIHGRKGSKVGTFKYAEDRPVRWVNETDPWVHGYWFWDWSEQRHHIKSIDTENKVIELDEPYHSYGYRKGQWYYGFNLLCELDAPGEWYMDREAGVLYFWPPAPVQDGDVMVSVLSTLVTIEDASHVTFQGFLLEGCRGTALRVSGGERDEIVGCTVRNVGGSAISVSGGREHLVFGCDVYNTGSGGISASGGDRKTLTPAHHNIQNNHVHHYARIKRVYAPGISLGGVGNRAAHNLIHNAPHMGMGFGGNDHIIELNEIHSVCYESNDAGAIYTGRNWTMRGNMLRHNYMHHITGFENRGCVGMYLDDMFSSADMVGNVYYKVTMAAFIGGGRDCSIVNNIFVDCNPALHIDARALGWAHGHADGWIEEAKEKGTLTGIAYNKPPYSTRYPELVNIIEDEPKAPKGNLIARNICVGGKWDTSVNKAARPYLKFEDNLVDVDVHFVDRENLDFRLKEDSPAFEIGFEKIPVEKIGLYEDARRASWPVTHSVRE